VLFFEVFESSILHRQIHTHTHTHQCTHLQTYKNFRRQSEYNKFKVQYHCVSCQSWCSCDDKKLRKANKNKLRFVENEENCLKPTIFTICLV